MNSVIGSEVVQRWIAFDLAARDLKQDKDHEESADLGTIYMRTLVPNPNSPLDTDQQGYLIAYCLVASYFTAF